ncbi:C2 domain-containing protein [Glomus cerebriforme]|uniref:C2 domain-containing protein n=1 Tax=Glomus cerebriforme TaxID=658196 RepID=A0A397T5E4_9GLOM|nr:C2 domain-containing protein [Glomus cerebriforme]
MTQGILKVTVVEARNLKDEDLIGKSDPYVKLILDKHNFQSTKPKNEDLNPTYNEYFIFNINGQKKLEVQVWDKDTFGDDDLIGEDNIKLSEVFSRGYVDIWVNLTKGKLGFRSKGELHLILEFAPK